MTESARAALVGLRDFSTLQWYVVPLLALLFYIYVGEIRSARHAQSLVEPGAHRVGAHLRVRLSLVLLGGEICHRAPDTARQSARAAHAVFAVAIGLDVVGLGVLGWTY